MAGDLPPSVHHLAALLQEDAADLYENAPCGYLSTSLDGIILRANATFATMTGHPATSLIGRRRFLDLLTPGGRVFYETHVRPLLRMQGFVREIALDVTCGDGGQLPALVNATERRDSSGEGVIRITVFDATDRRRYERELVRARRTAEEAAQARSDLIAMVSHDVRAPLSAVLTAAAILEKREMTPAQARYVRIIQSSANHALALLNSILDLSSLEAGRAVLRQRRMDLRSMVEQVVSGVRVTAAHKPDLTVTTRVGDDVPTAVLGDRDKIAQVLTNLLTNAVKFTERGLVSLMVYPRAQQPDRVDLEFIVSDTGIGIPADRLPYIFDEFTQATDEIGEKYGGTGLGLSISRKLLRLFDSELHVTSALGQGTTFSFVLSLERPAPDDRHP